MRNIIDIGTFRLQAIHRQKPPPEAPCDHKHLTLDDGGGIVQCMKCNMQISAFWALSMLIVEYDAAYDRLVRETASLAKKEAIVIHMPAAQEIERAWSNPKMTPSCPHCRRGIPPEDGMGRFMINREIEARRREVERNQANLASSYGANTP